MKTYISVLAASLVFLTSCGSDAEQADMNISYTHLKDCTEQVDNVNAAFSVLKCPKVGDYQLSISQQSPVFFTVQLQKGKHVVTTDFESLSGELPLDPGKALEWHLKNAEPHLLVFRLGWGTEAEPFAFKQHLVINYVGKDSICPLATIDVKKNADANQKARDLVAGQFKNVNACPEKIAAM